MMSADPTVPDALNPQAWNRYSYVGNDPLTFTDPSGFNWLSHFFRAAGRIFSPSVLRSLAQIAIAALLTAGGPVGVPIWAIALGVAMTAAAVTGMSGGSMADMLKAGAIAGATVFAFNIVGSLTSSAPGTPFDVGKYVANIAGHAGVGCLSAVASGGSCEAGALSAGAGAAIAPVATKGGLVGGTALSGVVGGLASLAGGAKFADGAVTAAFGYLFNSQFHSRTAVPFTDDQGNAVLDINENPIQRPSDVPPSFFVDAGEAAAAADAASADAPGMTSRAMLLNFAHGGAWDVQRVGADGLPTPAFISSATVGIGLFGASAGIPAGEILSYQNTYAGLFSVFSPGTVYDSFYTNLPASNVFNTNTGYRLYQSGAIGPSRAH